MDATLSDFASFADYVAKLRDYLDLYCGSEIDVPLPGQFFKAFFTQSQAHQSMFFRNEMQKIAVAHYGGQDDAHFTLYEHLAYACRQDRTIMNPNIQLFQNITPPANSKPTDSAASASDKSDPPSELMALQAAMKSDRKQITKIVSFMAKHVKPPERRRDPIPFMFEKPDDLSKPRLHNGRKFWWCSKCTYNNAAGQYSSSHGDQHPDRQHKNPSERQFQANFTTPKASGVPACLKDLFDDPNLE